MKIRISKEFSFEMAHALDGYDGLCRNIHGHSFHLTVTVIGEPITDGGSPKLGMVMDFGDLKKIVSTSIIDIFDHAFVIKKDTLGDFQSCCDPRITKKIIELDFQPTSENLLAHFSALLQPALPDWLSLFSLKLRETATSYSEWFLSDNS